MTADICILVEGAYPFVSGGVASWIDDLISSLPQFTFSVVAFSATPRQPRQVRYERPANVIAFRELFLHDARWAERDRRPREHTGIWPALTTFHRARGTREECPATALMRQLCAPSQEHPIARDLLHGQQSWRFLTEEYNDKAPNCSFLQYFWTFRFTHLPLFYLLEAPLPPARIYHAISCGYNSFSGVVAKVRSGAPLIVTEHGIYAREREIEIAQSDWIFDERDAGPAPAAESDHLRHWWVKMFGFLARFSYEHADCIISITGENQSYQRQYGADPRKMRVIPNGIDTAKWQARTSGAGDGAASFVVGFVGRVVTIKDVKTFIRAIKIASATIPALSAYVVGPEDEEPEYAEQCHQLVATLGLAGTVHFEGRANVGDYYCRMDALVLTSLSEAQPLVILEANCAGVPVVATDVGACREMLLGLTVDDQALGPSGIITPAADPHQTASALISLWQNRAMRLRMARAGQERVHRYYSRSRLYASYDQLYRQYLLSSPVA